MVLAGRFVWKQFHPKMLLSGYVLASLSQNLASVFNRPWATPPITVSVFSVADSTNLFKDVIKHVLAEEVIENVEKAVKWIRGHEWTKHQIELLHQEEMDDEHGGRRSGLTLIMPGFMPHACMLHVPCWHVGMLH